MAKDITKIEDEEKKKARKYAIIRYAVGGVIMLSILFAYLGGYGAFSGTLSWKALTRVLSDGFFLSGGLVLASGLLVVVANAGEFYFLSYTVKRILSKFVHSLPEATMSYGDYITARKGKKTPFMFLIVLGGAFVIVAGIFAGMNMNAADDPVVTSSISSSLAS